MNDRDAVFATLEEYANAYCAKDADRVMALFDDGEDISLIGTGADELCTGHSPSRRFFYGISPRPPQHASNGIGDT